MAGNVAGTFADAPLGLILHGSRSGQPYSINREYAATVNYVASGAAGLGWNATVGDGVVALHMAVTEWGWNARGASSRWAAVELAQANLGDPISALQIEGAAAMWVKLRDHYGKAFPLRFVNHSDLLEGRQDGKTDVEMAGQHSVIDRVTARLKAAGYS